MVVETLLHLTPGQRAAAVALLLAVVTLAVTIIVAGAVTWLVNRRKNR